MISLPDLAAGAIPFALPMRRTFRGLDVREGMLIKGPSGWGEFAPFDDYSPLAASRWLECAIEAAYGQWPTPVRESVPVNAIIPEVSADDAAGLTREAIRSFGCTTIKIKVGGTLADDEARVASVRDALDAVLGRGQGAIRIDANAAWSVDQAAKALGRLSQYGLEYVEQPCPTADDLRALRSRIDVRIAADESIRRSDDPGAVRVGEFADVAILKAPPLGGARAVVELAEGLDVPVVMSGALDSATGLDSGVAAAAALSDLPFACGFGTGGLFVADVTEQPRVPIDGALTIGRTPPDLPSLLAARDRISAERVDYWQARLAEAWQALSSRRGR